MKRHGYKRTTRASPRPPGHQNCGICHPPIKSGRDLEKRRTNLEVLDGLDDWSIRSSGMSRDLNEDLRVAHARPETLSSADLVRRAEVVALLRALTHELTGEQRRHNGAIRASFEDAGDYVELLGTRDPHVWVLGALRRVDGRLCLFRSGERGGVFEVLAEALPEGARADGRMWFGRAVTDRASFPVGPIDVLERVDGPEGGL